MKKNTQGPSIGFLNRREPRPWKRILRARLGVAVALSLMLLPRCGSAQGPRVLPQGELPPDARLKDLRDLNGYFPLVVPETERAWHRRAERVRRQLLVSQGLWPMPTRRPLKAVVHGKIERDDYTVERVYFETWPGFFVTGSLYRPKGTQGPSPGILCPHGHWAQGRFYDMGEDAVKRQIADGAEQFAEGGRSPLQARCVGLARMGCVVFFYDMIGYADNTQISFELAHRFKAQRAEMNATDAWGLFSPQAESHCQSVMGLQTYNSIRALDFLASLPDVDTSRLAVTGASGGGTQSMIVAAVDPRISVSFPAVMVSTSMQGGCTCENACGLRVGTGNIEFAALFAPKPQGVTAADDWTRELKAKGFPELRQVYQLLGRPQDVMLHSRTEFKHNYNQPSRMAMYAWMNRHLGLNVPKISERDYQRLSRAEASVWNSEHPKPPGGEPFERRLLADWHQDGQRQLLALTPKDDLTHRAFRETVGGAVDVILGRDLPAASDVEFEQIGKQDQGDHLEISGLLRNTEQGEALPVVFLYPKQWDRKVVIWLDEQGKAGLFDMPGKPKAEVMRLVENGCSVVGVDLLYQGEFLTGDFPARTRQVENGRDAAAYTFGYNHSVFAQRVHDVLALVSYARHHEYTPEQVHLVALGKAGPWGAAARAQARDAIDKAALETGGFRFAQVTDLHSPDFLPGGAKYFDLPGMLALSAPDKLWLAGEAPEAISITRACYTAAGATGNLQVSREDAETVTADAVAWLLED